jgi:NAD(P)H dehydrogenase (quinone)
MLEYLGLEVMDPFVAYAAPRVDAAIRTEYLRDWEIRLLAAASDTNWHARLVASRTAAQQNRVTPDGNAWASRK